MRPFGLVLYIDNGINNSGEMIPQKLIANMQKEDIAYIAESNLVSDRWIEHNYNIIQFVIMDWGLWDDPIVEPSEESEQSKIRREMEKKEKEKNNVDFIKQCIKYNLPIIVFTQFEKKDIEAKLIDLGLISNGIEEIPLLFISKKKKSIMTSIRLFVLLLLLQSFLLSFLFLLLFLFLRSLLLLHF